MLNPLKEVLKSFPSVRRLIGERDRLNIEAENLRTELDLYKTWVPPGHYYSPLNTEASIKPWEDRIYGPPPRSLTGLDLDEGGQLKILEDLENFYPDLPWESSPKDGLRYAYDNINYSWFDAITLFGMLRRLKPPRVIEVGSGYSSCVMLDTNELFMDQFTDFTFIDPNPELLRSLVRPGDLERCRLITDRVHDVDLNIFDSLRAGDFLFIDSSHVAKTGSDVCHILFEILPRLAKGVTIHFHDVYYPFEYIKKIVYWGISWNEAYMLRSFLLYNDQFRIRFLNTFIAEFYRVRLERTMPLSLNNTGGSLYLEKTGQTSTPQS
jgi:hypothetical protein